MVASTKTDRSLGTVNILHQGDEAYENIWQKIRSVWSYVYDNYYRHFDWFHIGGDDLYLIVENLRLYVESEAIRSAANGGKEPLNDWEAPFQTPLFLGRRFAEQGNMERIFNSGGAGYTINRAALKLLVRIFPNCYPNYMTFAEDVMVAECFRNQGVLPYDTRDDFGGERYMPFTPGDHFSKQWHFFYFFSNFFSFILKRFPCVPHLNFILQVIEFLPHRRKIGTRSILLESLRLAWITAQNTV